MSYNSMKCVHMREPDVKMWYGCAALHLKMNMK